jgi:hypothetical protein
MQLQMYINDRLVETVPVSLYGTPAQQQKCLQEEIQRLVQKHKETLNRVEAKPTFFLEGVPARWNHFHPLIP